MSYQSQKWPVLEVKDAGDDDEVKKALADMQAAFDTKTTEFAGEVKSAKDEAKDAQDRADELETRIARGIGNLKSENEETIEAKAFNGYLRVGRDLLEPDELKALNVGTDTAGGYLAHDDFQTELIKNLVEFSPIRAAARISQTSSGSVKLPTRTGSTTASWVDETAARPETAPAYGQVDIPIHEAACYVDISNKLLEDAEIDIAAELSTDFAEEFGRIEGAAFVSGNGTLKPTGFMNGTAIASINGGHASQIQSDGLIDIFYSLKAAYRNRGVWTMNGTTLSAIRKLKDGDGNYLWRPGLTEGQPETILGRPVIDAVDMPDVAANAFPVAFGDYNRGYRIIDRVGVSVLRDPYSQATTGITRFHARKRVGAAVVKAEAMKKLKIAA